ncbi:MAG: nucleotidyltransferase domain-containing protein [Actinomycetota bacterium]
MTRLIPSRHALEAVAALGQRPDGLRLTDLAAAVGMPSSSAQRALELLGADGFVDRHAGRARHRLVRDHPAVAALEQLALRSLPADAALDIVVRANDSIEFAGKDADGYLVVIRGLADPADEVRLAAAIETTNADRNDARPVACVRHDEVRGPSPDPGLRARAASMTILRGSVERSFPAPSPGRGRGRPLGRLHPTLPTPSERGLADIARRHRIARVVVFGSAVRSDFRPDSDIDVLVEPRAGSSLRLDDVVALRARLEDAFGRDVEIVNAFYARPGVVARAAEEGVVLRG